MLHGVSEGVTVGWTHLRSSLTISRGLGLVSFAHSRHSTGVCISVSPSVSGRTVVT